ncbi:MAG TPA: hypothetical protein VII56_17200 [Rhizomicrobium sp.]
MALKLVAGCVRCCAALPIFALPGCVSYSYIDANTVQHVVGFVDIATPLASGKAGEPAATSVTVTSFGVSLHRSPAADNGLTLGYSSETIVSLPSGACLDLNAKGVCASLRALPAHAIE